MAYIDFTGANNMHNMFRNDYTLPWYDITGRAFGNRRLYNKGITEPIEKIPISTYADSFEYSNPTSYSFDKYLPEKTKSSIFNNTNIGNGLTAASAALDIAGTAFNLGRGEADITGYQALARSLADTQFAGTNESLIAQRNSTQDMTRKSYSDIGGISNGKIATSSLGNAISGATAGLTVGGPIGAAIGGVVGLGSGIIGGILGHNKDRAKQRKLNAEIARSNNIMHNNFDNAVRNNDRSSYKFGMMNQFALGGDLESNDTTFNPFLTLFNEGGSHEENPYGGIPQGIAEDGQPNLVEEGEVKWNDYIFSKRLTIPDNDLEMYKIAKRYKGKSYADIARDLYKEKADRPVDSISDKTMAANLQKLQMSQEMLKAQQKEQQAGEQMAFALGGLLGHKNNHIFADGGEKEDKKVYYPMRINNSDGTYTMATDGYSPVSDTPGYYVMQDNDGNRMYGVPQNEDEWKQVASYYTTMREPVPSEVNKHLPGNRSVGEYIGPSQWMQEFNTVGSTPLNWTMMLPAAGTVLPELVGAGNAAFGPKLAKLSSATKAALSTQAGRNFLWGSGAVLGMDSYLNSPKDALSTLDLALALVPGNVKIGEGVYQAANSTKKLLRTLGLTRQEARNLQLGNNIFNTAEEAEKFVKKTGQTAHVLGADKDGKVSKVVKFVLDEENKNNVLRQTVDDAKSWISEARQMGNQFRQNVKSGGDLAERVKLLKPSQYEKLSDETKKLIQAFKSGDSLSEDQLKLIEESVNAVTRKMRASLAVADNVAKVSNGIGNTAKGFGQAVTRSLIKGNDLGKTKNMKYNLFYKPKPNTEQLWKTPSEFIHFSPNPTLWKTPYGIDYIPGLDKFAKSQSELLSKNPFTHYFQSPESGKALHTYLMKPNFWGSGLGKLINDRRSWETLGGAAGLSWLAKALFGSEDGDYKPVENLEQSINDSLNYAQKDLLDEDMAKKNINEENAETNPFKNDTNFYKNSTDDVFNFFDTLGRGTKKYADGGLLKQSSRLPMFGSSEWDNFTKSPYYGMLNGGLPTGLSEYNYTPNDMHFVNPADYGDPWKYTQAGVGAEHYNPMNISNITDIENSDWYKNNFLNSLKTNDNYLKAVIDGYLSGLPEQGYDNLRRKLALKDDFSNRDSVYNEFVKLATDHKAGLAHNPMIGDRYYWEDKNGKRTYIDKPTDGNFTINPDYTWDGTWRDYRVTMNPRNNSPRKKKANESTAPQLSSSLTPEGTTPEGEASLSNTTREKVSMNPLMFAPVLGDSLNYLNASLTKPDYSDVNLIAPHRINVGWHPIGNYQKYQPVDVDYYINKLDQQRLGTQSLLSNSVNGNQAAYQAGILQNDTTNRNAVAEAMQAAEAENYKRYNDVTRFNRETDEANQKADITVQGQRVDAEKAFMDALYKYAIARKGVKDQYDTTRAYFGQKMFDDLGNIGKHLYMVDALDSEKYRLLYADEQAKNAAKKHACGGYLTIKTR